MYELADIPRNWPGSNWPAALACSSGTGMSVQPGRSELQTAIAGSESGSLQSRKKKTAGSVEIFQNPSCRVSSQQALASQTGRAGDLQSGGTPSLHVCLAVSGTGSGQAAGHSSPEPAVWHFSNLLVTRESQRSPGIRFELIFRSHCAVQALDRSLHFSSGFLGRSGRVNTGPALFPLLGTR